MNFGERFVSVSGVTSLEELEQVKMRYIQARTDSNLVIGYQASNKSINQGTKNSRQPEFMDLRELDRMTKEAGFTTAVHYYTKDISTTFDDLAMVEASGVSVRNTLVQFNTLPLDYATLRDVRDMGFGVIFKVAVSDKQTPQGGYAVWKGQGVQDVSSGDVEPLVQQARERAGVINYVMFDPSHGTNLDLDLRADSLAVRFGRRILECPELEHVGLVYAGGIKPQNVEAVTRSLKRFLPRDRVSIDVESGVRTDDKLDMRKVEEYLRNYQNAINEK